MSSFPFYDSFNVKTKDKDLTEKQKKDFIKKMTRLDKNGLELFYAIIKVHDIKNTDNFSSFKIPYSGKYVDGELQFNIENFPYKLKQILNKFLTMHIKKIKEDKRKKE